MTEQQTAETITVQTIGKIGIGIDGADQYVLLRCDEDASDDQIHNWLLERCYRDTNTPGGYFCHRVTILPHLDSDSRIGIIHHRYDV